MHLLTNIAIFISTICILLNAAFAQDNKLVKEPVTKFIPSYEEIRPSILFSPSEIDRYIDIIRRVEETMQNGTNVNSLQLENILAEDENEEVEDDLTPLIYPSFYLSSIIYHNPAQWFIRINGITITNANNNEENELYVKNIHPDYVTLLWYPQNTRLSRALLTKREPDDALPPHAETIKHRMIREPSSIPQYYNNTGRWQLALQANHIFLSEYMHTYEGKPEDILPPPPPPPPLDEQGALIDLELDKDGNVISSTPNEENTPDADDLSIPVIEAPQLSN